MTRSANWNYIKPEFFGVAAMVMIVAGLFSATTAFEGRYVRQLFSLDGVSYSQTSGILFRIFEITLYLISKFLGRVSPFPILAVFWMSLPPSLVARAILFWVFVIGLFDHFPDFFAVGFSVFFSSLANFLWISSDVFPADRGGSFRIGLTPQLTLSVFAFLAKWLASVFSGLTFIELIKRLGLFALGTRLMGWDHAMPSLNSKARGSACSICPVKNEDVFRVGHLHFLVSEFLCLLFLPLPQFLRVLFGAPSRICHHRGMTRASGRVLNFLRFGGHLLDNQMNNYPQGLTNGKPIEPNGLCVTAQGNTQHHGRFPHNGAYQFGYSLPRESGLFAGVLPGIQNLISQIWIGNDKEVEQPQKELTLPDGFDFRDEMSKRKHGELLIRMIRRVSAIISNSLHFFCRGDLTAMDGWVRAVRVFAHSCGSPYKNSKLRGLAFGFLPSYLLFHRLHNVLGFRRFLQIELNRAHDLAVQGTMVVFGTLFERLVNRVICKAKCVMFSHIEIISLLYSAVKPQFSAVNYG